MDSTRACKCSPRRPIPLFTGGLDPRECQQLALAIGSLLRKGYFSTVGAVKVEGSLQLPMPDYGGPISTRECSLVDFAGQMEYLVSHQLLLASMHTLCVLIQPLGSFADATNRRHGSWRYWLQFLRALGDRRGNSMVLSVSQLDKVPTEEMSAARAAVTAEFAALRAQVGAGLGESPLELDYRPDEIESSLMEARRRLSEAAEAVSKDWWVPMSYERLADLPCMHGLTTAPHLPPFPTGGCPRAMSGSRRWCVP